MTKQIDDALKRIGTADESNDAAAQAVIMSSTALATMPSNVFVDSASTGLPRDSVVNVTTVVALNKSDLGDYSRQIPDSLLNEVDRGLRRVLDL